MKRNKGITLIALVVTIIVLLILAGVTIALVLSDNGLLNRASYAKEEYIKAGIKEEIEIAILDIQTDLTSKSPSEAITKEILINNIQDKVSDTITIDDNLTGEYKGYEYWIDNKYIVHVGEQINNIIINLKLNMQIGTTYFTVTVDSSSKLGAITEYKYIIDESEILTTATNSYTKNDLQPETEHTLKVIVTDDKSNTKESQLLTIKTKPRTYLYNRGDECVNLTGGFVDGFNPQNILVEKGSDYIQVTGLAGRPNEGNIVTNNAIDLTNYKKLKIICDHNGNNNGGYFGYALISKTKISGYSSADFLYSTGPGPNASAANNVQFGMDLSQIEGNAYLKIGSYANTKYLKVYEIFLEE